MNHFPLWVMVCLVLMAAAVAAPAQSANTTAACLSGVQWTRGNSESPEMHPGGSCIDCHAQGEGPKFLAAGTVFQALTEPDDCYGVKGVVVQLTDAKGQVLAVTTNASGNFFFGGRGMTITFPITAKLIAGGTTREMSSEQSTGNCALCHTAKGANGAPGRIIAPTS
jgi:mono/diheme cytochrome c family protein